MSESNRAITVTCDDCSKAHRVQDDEAGKPFLCLGCGKLLQVGLSVASDAEFANFVEDVMDDDDSPQPARLSPVVHPPPASGVMVCQIDGSEAVIVDFEKRTIQFANCHTPRKFLAFRPEPEFSCPVTDLRAMHRLRDAEPRGRVWYRPRIHALETLMIVTSAGTAVVPSTALNFEPLCQYLAANIPGGGAAFSEEHPAMLLIAGCGAFVGFIVSWSLTPQNARNIELWRNLLGGTFVVCWLTFLFVRFALFTAVTYCVLGGILLSGLCGLAGIGSKQLTLMLVGVCTIASIVSAILMRISRIHDRPAAENPEGL